MLPLQFCSKQLTTMKHHNNKNVSIKQKQASGAMKTLVSFNSDSQTGNCPNYQYAGSAILSRVCLVSFSGSRLESVSILLYSQSVCVEDESDHGFQWLRKPWSILLQVLGVCILELHSLRLIYRNYYPKHSPKCKIHETT